MLILFLAAYLGTAGIIWNRDDLLNMTIKLLLITGSILLTISLLDPHHNYRLVCNLSVILAIIISTILIFAKGSNSFTVVFLKVFSLLAIIASILFFL